MPGSQNHASPALPKHVVLQLSTLAKVPTKYRREFREYISDNMLQIWKKDRRAQSREPAPALIEIAKAACTLQQRFYRLNNEDRDWVEHMKDFQVLFGGGEIHNLENTILNLALVFSQAAGMPAPLPPHVEKMFGFGPQLKVRDQMLRELVFSLLSVAAEVGGEFTFDKNFQRGTLVQALELLRNHLPKGLVPEFTST